VVYAKCFRGCLVLWFFCDVASCNLVQVPTFRRNILPKSSGQEILYPETGGSMSFETTRRHIRGDDKPYEDSLFWYVPSCRLMNNNHVRRQMSGLSVNTMSEPEVLHTVFLQSRKPQIAKQDFGLYRHY
jgi:hypothetical protein